MNNNLKDDLQALQSSCDHFVPGEDEVWDKVRRIIVVLKRYDQALKIIELAGTVATEALENSN